MKLKKIIVFLITILSIAITSAMERQFTTPKPHTIFIDISALIEVDQMAAARQIGLWNLGTALFGSMIGGHKIEDTMPIFFSTLRNLNDKKPPYEILYQGHEAPYQLYELLTNQKNPETILSEVESQIENQYLANGSLMLQSAKISFNPTTNTNVMTPIVGMVTLLQKLKENDHTLQLFGNWNKDAFELLKQKLPKEFSLFDQHFISGNLGYVKQPRMYEEMLKLSKAEPGRSIVIESNQTGHYLDQAQLRVKPEVVTFYRNNINALRKTLSQSGLILEED